MTKTNTWYVRPVRKETTMPKLYYVSITLEIEADSKDEATQLAHEVEVTFPDGEGWRFGPIEFTDAEEAAS